MTLSSPMTLLKRYRQRWVEKYLGTGNNIRFESPQRLIKQIAWPDPGTRTPGSVRGALGNQRPYRDPFHDKSNQRDKCKKRGYIPYIKDNRR